MCDVFINCCRESKGLGKAMEGVKVRGGIGKGREGEERKGKVSTCVRKEGKGKQGFGEG